MAWPPSLVPAGLKETSHYSFYLADTEQPAVKEGEGFFRGVVGVAGRGFVTPAGIGVIVPPQGPIPPIPIN